MANLDITYIGTKKAKYQPPLSVPAGANLSNETMGTVTDC